MNRAPSRTLLAAALMIGVVACSANNASLQTGVVTVGPTTASAAASIPPPVEPSPKPAASSWPAVATEPSSGRILFTIERDGVVSQPAYIDTTGLHVIPVATDTTLAHATWAPGDTIIFDSERAGRRHLFRMGIDGGNIVQLTSGTEAGQDSATVSPDGSRIAYGTFIDSADPTKNQDTGIHIAKLDGSDPRPVTKPHPVGDPGGDDDASFSPDGRWIAFERAVNFDTGQSAIFIVRTDGTGERRLTPDSLGAVHPRWSADGKRVLFSRSTDPASGSLWIVDVAGGTPTALAAPAVPGQSSDAGWSPDGGQIVFRQFTNSPTGSIQLHVFDADGSHETTLWVGPTGYGPNRPVWSR